MNEKINTDLAALELIFNRNKPYIFRVVIILISIILFIQFVIPQFKALLETQEQIKESSKKLETLKANLNILNSIDEEALNSQFEILSAALPLNKDLIGVLNSVYFAAQKTGVNLGSFSFATGDLSKSESGSNFPVVKLSVPIKSEITAINDFIQTISRIVPLAEVSLIKIGNASSMVDLSFYYMPLSASNYDQDARVSPISQKGLTLVDQLSKYENVFFSNLPVSEVTPISIITPSPTVTSVSTVVPSPTITSTLIATPSGVQ